MGKHTLYHPLGLNVIRGAAEYGGWKIGRITQTVSDISNNTARYICCIDRLPGGATGWPVKAIKRQLQHSFMDDVTVEAVWITAHGQWFCTLAVIVPVDDSHNGDMA